MKTHAMESYFEKIARTFAQQRDVRVVLTGATCATDGETTIAIPANADYLQGQDRQILEGMLDHEWLHVREETETKRAHAAGLKATSPASLMKRALRDDGTARKAQVGMMLNVYEDLRIEAKGSRDFPGVGENLDRLHGFLLRRNRGRVLRGEKVDPWWLIGAGIIYRVKGDDVSWMPPEALAVLDRLDDLIAEARTQRTVDDAYRLARATVERIEGMIEETPPPPQDGKGGKGEGNQGAGPGQDGKGEKAEGDEDGSPVGDDEGDADAEGDEGEGDADAEGDEGEGDADAEGDEGEGEGDKGTSGGRRKQSEGGGGRESEKARGGEPPRETPAAPDPASEFARALTEATPESKDLKDEARKRIKRAALEDARKNHRYLPHPDAVALDTVEQIRVHRATYYEEQYNALLRTIQGPATTLRQKILAVLRQRAASRWQGGRERGAVDPATLYGLRFGDRRVFAERERGEEIGAAVAIVIDESGSMVGPKVEAAQAAATALSECLSKIPGVAFMVCGFDTMQDERVRFEPPYTRFGRMRIRVFKTWEQPYRTARLNMTAITARQCNVDGEAVLYAARQLAARPEERKVMIVFSDGLPRAVGSPTEALENHLRETVQRALRAGIEVIGAGMMTDAPAEFYPTHFRVDEMKDFPAALMRVLGKLLIDRRGNDAPARRSA